MSQKKMDWRIMGQDRYLKDVTLVHRKYRQYAANPAWDHDYCNFCTEKFMLEDGGPEMLNQGYATEDDYYWVCEDCFDDFRKSFNWTVIEKMDERPVERPGLRPAQQKENRNIRDK